ncbi:MAG TPA: hypothetical protein VEI01_02225 [Terriglobales bacterium]|nr:hypothetical protein [Terriglobales bacterium]
MKCKRVLIATVSLVVFLSAFTSAQDPGWPRKHVESGGTLIAYQPQIDDWKDFTDATWRQAFQLTPAGGKQVIGAATFKGTTNVDHDKHMVAIYGIQVTNTYFPDLDPATSARMDQLLRTFVPPVVNISLERVVAYVPKTETANTVHLNNDPPFIFVSYSPAILLSVDGEPVLAAIPNTKLKYVVNTQWPVFFDLNKSQYYLLVDKRWFMAGDLHGPWSVATTLPKDMDKVTKEAQWQSLQEVIPPPPQPGGPIPKIFYSTVPAEVILFEGKPVYANIPQTQLVYATNTDSPIFVYTPSNEYYYLAAGRWFRSKNLEGHWDFASLDLPADFARIPLSSPASAVLASVPGTEEAKDAVLIAQIPTVMEIDPKSAAAQAKVSYTGDPKFAPIEGTSLQYATNTPDKVIQVGDVYYLCLQGVWFMSTTPQGPWTTASSVPQVIYTIPPSSPIYNVTYVTQTTTSSGTVQSSYTAGYLGAFVMGAAVGAIVCSGTGYYYPPYVGYPAYGYPVYHPYPTPYGAYGYSNYYNPRTGSYGVSQTAYGPYGSATRAASYNPYTGTYKQGASVTTPYGRQSAGQAYNPYTGSYGATHQGSSPTAQWGQSYVSQGNKSAYTQHYSTAQGTVASAQGSQGGKAYATSSGYGNTYAGKSSSGDLYAGHDGNVYQNNGSGWQKYNNSTNSWSNVNTQQAQQQAQQEKANYQQQHPTGTQPSSASYQQREQSFNQERSSGGWSSQNLNSEMQNRQRGVAQSQNWQSSGGSRGGWGGGGRSWGGGGGGWRR